MKKLITSILILYCSSVIVAQTTAEDDYFSKPKITSTDKISTSIIAGWGYSFLNSTKSSIYSTFIAPKIGYQISPKFKLDIGLMHYSASGNTFMQLNSDGYILNTGNKPVSGNLVFVGGNYQLNQRLIMSGSMMMDANNLYTKQSNYKVATLGLDYKVSEHSSIGIKASLAQGNSNNYLNSGMENYNYNPNIMNSTGSLFLSPLTQWGIENSFNPVIR